MNMVFPYFFVYLVAGLLVYVLIPRLIFVQAGESGADNFFANYTRMTLLVVLLGYFLVLTKLYEFLSVTLLFIFFILRKYYLKKSKTNRLKTFKEIQLWVFDFLEGMVNLPNLLKERIKKKTHEFQTKPTDKKAAAFTIVLFSLSATGYALYLRIFDSFVNAAPAMSDAYVTLAWMKYINNRILFYDGIYPQGYYIYQAVLQKFSSIDPLYVLKFTGPISAVLIAGGLYFSVSHFLKCKYSGLVAALSYGLFGMFFTGSWERQAATNSQEFAFLFIMPCLFYFYRYAKERNRTDLWIAFSGLTVIGLVHSLAFVYAVMGMIVLAISFLLNDFRSLKASSRDVFLSGVASLTVSLVPIAIGLVLGKSFHSASADFFVATESQATVPHLMISDYLSLAGMTIGLIGFLFIRKSKQATALLFLSLFGIASFALYYWGGAVTGSLVIAARARELFSIISPVMVGLVFYLIFQWIQKVDQKERIRMFSVIALTLMMVGWTKPDPIIPYKMERNSNVIQYMRISREYRPTEWMIVSQEEGYAMAYGKGWHLMVGDFMSEYTSSDEIYVGSQTLGERTRIPHVFVFLEKELYETYETMKELEEIRQRREQEILELEMWISSYKMLNDNITLYYQDEHLMIYHIYQEEAYEDISSKVLGPEKG
jgi:hypothetical protein